MVTSFNPCRPNLTYATSNRKRRASSDGTGRRGRAAREAGADREGPGTNRADHPQYRTPVSPIADHGGAVDRYGLSPKVAMDWMAWLRRSAPRWYCASALAS